MQDQALLESVSELVTLASEGIHAALAELPSEANDSDLTAALEACQGSVETIAMAADMAQLNGLQQLCGAVSERLATLDEAHWRQFRTDLSPRLIDWSHAVRRYVQQPSAGGITEPLFALVPGHQHESLRLGLSETDLTLLDVSIEQSPECAPNQCGTVLDAAIDPVVVPEAADITAEFTALDMAADKASIRAEAKPSELNVCESSAETPPAEASSEPSALPDMVAGHSEAKITADAQESPEAELFEAEERVTLAAQETAAADKDTQNGSARLFQAETLPAFPAAAQNTTSDLLGYAADLEEKVEAFEQTENGDQTEPSEDTDDVAEGEERLSLTAQLAETFSEFEPWCQRIGAESDPAQLQAACAAYVQILGRVQTAAAVIGLSGLEALCQQLGEQVEALGQAPVATREATCKLLAQWPALAQAYLSDPEGQDPQFALAELIASPVWPQPLNEAQLEALFSGLQPDAGEYLAELEERPAFASPEDIDLALDPDVNPKLIEVFLQEAPLNAANFTASLERAMRGEEVVKNLANAQRLAHNLKGSANLVGVKGVANLTHHIEDILEYLTEHQQAPQASLSGTLQEAADCIEVMLETVQGTAESPAEAQRILQDVLDWARRMDAGMLDTTVHPDASANAQTLPEMAESALAETTNETEAEPGRPEAALKTQSQAALQTPKPVAAVSAPEVTVGKVLRVPTDAIDTLFRMVGEVSITLDQVQERVQALRRRSNEQQTQDTIIQQRRFELENYIDVRHLVSMQQRFSSLGQRQDFDPLELDQYDELYSTTRSFIESTQDARRMSQQLRSELSSLEHILGPLRRMKSDLQSAIMKVRMEPVESISARLQRSVRQACRASGKEAELIIEGEATLLDSEVLHKLADPLMHMLRNAVDHGIENADERRAKGKPIVGAIRLRFYQDGQNILVECRDDGRGLDYEAIRRNADARNIPVTGSNRQDLARLIFLPGFSTRSGATQLSGRGVGMDVVQTTIRELKGILEISDAPGGGCQIMLRLPITLMTSHSLVVRVLEERYAIPSSSILRVLSPRAGHYTQVGATMAYETGQEAYPAVSLAALLGLSTTHGEQLRPDSSVLLIYSDTGPVAVAVDQVVNSYHLVLKNLGRYIRSLRGIAGLSNLADGSLIPVLDVAELLRTPAPSSKPMMPLAQTAAANAARSRSARVLVVDDSLSVRQSLSELLEDEGFEVNLARDGMEAVDMLRKQPPDIVLSDIEMPRMNGLELLNYIRTTHSTQLPVVMITSRTQQKHRQQAEQAGASEYVTKPFSEAALLDKMRALLGEGDG